MSLTITDLVIENKKLQKTPELDAIVKVMQKHGIKDPYSLLPTSTKHNVSFTLNNTFSAFANAIRRTLIDDIPTESMRVEEKDITTDDEFISGISDVLIKNIALVPIMQSADLTNKEIFLYVHNNTTKIIDIKARDIQLVEKIAKKKKGGNEDISDDEIEITDETPEADTYKTTIKPSSSKYQQNISIDLLIPDSNILLARLRPGKYIKIRNITIVQGIAANDAGKYSLLNNVSYEPLDITPYDQFTNKGTRSIEHDCKSFMVGFTTRGNISPKEVMKKVHKKLTDGLNNIKSKIKIYSEANAGIYYNNQECEVTIKDDVYTFKFVNHYISELFMIAMCCYKLDENIAYCNATVERYDSLIGILKIKHANVISILMKSIETCQKKLDILVNAF